MKKIYIFAFIAMTAAALLFMDITGDTEFSAQDYITSSGISPEIQKRRTIMVFMNGSDLETKHASATFDLKEMMDSGFDEENLNVIIFAGGSRRWHTPMIADGDNTLLKIENGELVKLAQVGRDPMGYPETLAGFINFCYYLYPAEEYGLILWNHGGGAIEGYGSDERFWRSSQSMMKLREIELALNGSDVFRNGKKFEFLGFDTCLMATLEMALVAERYAEFLIASEELEPEPGWDYTFLRDITPQSTGEQIGKSIVDYFGRYYSNPANVGYDDITTLSLTDLSKIKNVSDSFEKLALFAGDLLGSGYYRPIARARSGTRAFGGRGEYIDESDMVDLKGLSINLREMLPNQTADFERDLNEAVIYKFERNIDDLGGLSIYFPFENRNDLRRNLSVYRSINRLPEYTDFLDGFADILESRPLADYTSALADPHNISLNAEQLDNLHMVWRSIWVKQDSRESDKSDKSDRLNESKESEFGEKYIQINHVEAEIGENGVVLARAGDESTKLNGHFVCLYPLDRNIGHKRYTIPVKLNGEDAVLMVVYSCEYPDGKVTGAVLKDKRDSADKKIVRIHKGDKISILYYCMDVDGSYSWQECEEFGKEFTVGERGLVLMREKLHFDEAEYLSGVTIEDLQCNKHHSKLVKIER